ncbi:hypothetical protein ASG52_21700 [Methylobacterium sp. Leaf456]|uniref:hypothetical protein n=1 Tax=Methylobacterium sp. Leaf456 TaxID=1736382 RepID=UPI0006FBCF76|nr:hypothetical protein [Methylobacterium sp. Leaf456]KQT58473.1 hypothetical protein ASG52_21700 [Methylobacterium sp. Leaf456]
MTRSTLTKTALTVALALSAGGALAQTVPARGEAPIVVRGEIVRDGVVAERPLTVMGMTGGIEPKDVESTGSIDLRPEPRRIERLR